MKKLSAKTVSVLCVIAMVILTIAGCGNTSVTTVGTSNADQLDEEELPVIVASFYDNRGNNIINFEANSFNIQPNRAKQYGYDTEGDYTN